LGVGKVVMRTTILTRLVTSLRPVAVARGGRISSRSQYPSPSEGNLPRDHATYPEHWDFADGKQADDSFERDRPITGFQPYNTYVFSPV